MKKTREGENMRSVILIHHYSQLSLLDKTKPHQMQWGPEDNREREIQALPDGSWMDTCDSSAGEITQDRIEDLGPIIVWD